MVRVILNKLLVIWRPVNNCYCPFLISYCNFRHYSFTGYIFWDFYFLQISLFLTNSMSPTSCLFLSLRFRMSQFSEKNCEFGKSSLIWLHFGFRDKVSLVKISKLKR